MAQQLAGPSPNDPLGFDVYLREDIESDGRSATGIELVNNAILHRLTTGLLLLTGAPEGQVDYGEDVTTWCGQGLTRSQAEARGPQVAAIVQRDPRVAFADAAVMLAARGGLYELTITITGQTIAGTPIALILGVSSVTVDLLAEGQ